jgi:ketosteroid isomerase-like protein
MRLLLVVTLLAATACSSGEPATRLDSAGATATAVASRDATSDPAAIRATLDGWYRAMQDLDSAGTLSPLTPQFLLPEDTLPLSAAALWTRLKGGGAEAKWTADFSDMRTRFAGGVAWTTLRNHETSQDAVGKKCQSDFLETIVFVRDAERWRIDRYHAAALHRWSCSP